MKPLVFFMGIFNLLLASQNNLCHIILTSKNTPKVSPTIMSLFIKLGTILVMKTKVLLTKKKYYNVHHISILLLENTKYLQKHFTHFQILEFYFSNCHKFMSNSSTCKYLKKHDFNNLAFEVHENKN